MLIKYSLGAGRRNFRWWVGSRRHLSTIVFVTSLAAASLCGCEAGETTDDPPQSFVRTSYPETDFGTEEGETIANHSFTQADGSPLDFQDLRADESKQLLLLSTGAGWCTACREEQDTLQELQNAHGPSGLTVIVTLFEDNNRRVADADFVQGWIDQYQLTFDVVLDAPFVMDSYYDSTLTPMNMFIDLASMQIERITIGFDRSVVDAILNNAFPNP